MDDVEKVRILIPDTEEPYRFTDDQIQAFLDISDGDVYLAAALAIDTIIGNLLNAGAGTLVRTDDLTVDTKNTLDYWSNRATRLRGESESGIFDYFEIVYPYSTTPVCRPEATTWPWRA